MVKSIYSSKVWFINKVALLINSVDKPSIRIYSPPMQHRSFVRNQPFINSHRPRENGDEGAMLKVPALT